MVGNKFHWFLSQFHPTLFLQTLEDRRNEAKSFFMIQGLNKCICLQHFLSHVIYKMPHIWMLEYIYFHLCKLLFSHILGCSKWKNWIVLLLFYEIGLIFHLLLPHTQLLKVKCFVDKLDYRFCSVFVGQSLLGFCH